MIDQVTLFAAAARGDVATIERFFHQPTQRASLERTNRWLSEHYWMALSHNVRPFTCGGRFAPSDYWYVLCRSPGGPPYEQFFDAPAKNGHLAVAEWFCGVDASRIFGDAIRPMLELIYGTYTMNHQHSEQLTEMMISSHAVQTMSDREQAAVLKMMLSDAIGNNRPDIVRMLVAHGAICDDPSMMMMTAGYGDEATFNACWIAGSPILRIECSIRPLIAATTMPPASCFATEWMFKPIAESLGLCTPPPKKNTRRTSSTPLELFTFW